MNKFSKEIQIGLVAVVGVVVLYFGLGSDHVFIRQQIFCEV